MGNIELFDEFVAVVFARLYAAFPMSVALDAREISGHTDTNGYGAVVDAQGGPSMRFAVCQATVEWLIDTGYIRIKDKGQYGFGRAVLTAKGLEVLKSTPESVRAKDTIGDKLVKLMREGSVQMAKEAAKAAISYGIKVLG